MLRHKNGANYSKMIFSIDQENSYSLSLNKTYVGKNW